MSLLRTFRVYLARRRYSRAATALVEIGRRVQILNATTPQTWRVDDERSKLRALAWVGRCERDRARDALNALGVSVPHEPDRT